MGDVVEIREFQERDLDAIVEFSLRAWDPVFASLREVLGDPIFFRLKPDWKAAQAEEVRASCTSDERDAFVAVVDGRPVGFVTVALNAFNERMGVIEIIGVDPDFQRRGIASQLTNTRSTTCVDAEWTSQPWERAAIRATRLHAQPTSRSGSRFSRARGT